MPDDEALALADLREKMVVAERPQFTEPAVVLTAEEYAESVRLAQRHERKHRPPYDAIRISRTTGNIVGVIVREPRQRVIAHAPERREAGSGRRAKRSAARRGPPREDDPPRPQRPCKCGCGRIIDSRDPRKRYFDDACSSRARERTARSRRRAIWPTEFEEAEAALVRLGDAPELALERITDAWPKSHRDYDWAKKQLLAVAA